MIVKVNETNVHEAGRIHSASWSESHRAFCSEEFVALHSPERQTDFLRREMLAGKQIYMLIEERPIGIVAIHGNMIEHLYILPDEQRKGYGSSLLKFAMTQCTEAPRLWILDNNADARRLYERFGFEPSGAKNVLSPTLSEIEMTRR